MPTNNAGSSASCGPVYVFMGLGAAQVLAGTHHTHVHVVFYHARVACNVTAVLQSSFFIIMPRDCVQSTDLQLVLIGMAARQLALVTSC